MDELGIDLEKRLDNYCWSIRGDNEFVYLADEKKQKRKLHLTIDKYTYYLRYAGSTFFHPAITSGKVRN